MKRFAQEVIPVNIEDEVKQSYLDYAMSVIVGRALPDVRDGLKPVHRRVLFAMHELNNDYNKPYKKSARIVGDVIGKYHPHSDDAVYDTVVRMAQDFSMRNVLIDGQGNFGSVDGDEAAAMRYTEIRLSKIAHSLLADLDKDTVDFVPNYDGTEQVPDVLPTRVPNLLVNGASGIAVGMATNIPTHNLSEIIDACIALIENPDLTIDELMKHVPGPDFPTAGIINGRAGIIEAYRTGRGRILLRAKTHIEEDKQTNKQSIIITELPYQVNKAKLQEKIAELVKEKRIEGITAIRDESDRRGMRAVIELRRGENAEVMLNNLYSLTQIQTVYGINMVALEQGHPRTLNLKQLLEAFLRHRREVVIRRTFYELQKAKQRAHILEGLSVALANIEDVIALIRQAASPADAKEALLSTTWSIGDIESLLKEAGSQVVRPLDLPSTCGIVESGYRLSPAQAQAILDLRLHRLTGLEQDKITEEFKALIKTILELTRILEEPEKLLNVIRDELAEIKTQFGNERRTEIVDSQEDLTYEDLIAEQQVVVTLSNAGYVKYQPLEDYQAQHRGGKGKLAASIKEEDVIWRMMLANTHDTVLFFSNRGRVYWSKVYQLPQSTRLGRGKPIVNILPLENDERISAMLPLREYPDNKFVFMATTNGTVKKVPLSQFSRPRANGIIAIELETGNDVVDVLLTEGNQQIFLFSDAGKVLRFDENDVRAMGRTARGVRGMRLSKNQKLIALIVAATNDTMLTATANGYGKRTGLNEFRTAKRGGQGVVAIQVNKRNGELIGAVQANDEQDLMLISDKGTVVRTRANEISVVGRNAQGVRLIRLNAGEKLVGLQTISQF